MSLPTPESIPTLPHDTQLTVLETLFEPSPSLSPLLLPLLQTPHKTYPSLITSIRTFLHSLPPSSPSSPTEKLYALIAAHPRLGAPKVDSVQSAAEQAKLQGHVAELAVRNAEYEEKFPGLRYVVFVNGRDRGAIVGDMERRIARGDFEMEVWEAVEALCDIALDRAGKLMASSTA